MSDYASDIVNEAMMNLSTAYLAKVIAVTSTTATVQPLGKIKQYGEDAQKQAVVSNIPVLRNARNKITSKTITIDGADYTLAVLTPIAAGDIVLCVVCDRDITQALKGVDDLPPVGHHSKSDSVVVGVI